MYAGGGLRDSPRALPRRAHRDAPYPSMRSSINAVACIRKLLAMLNAMAYSNIPSTIRFVWRDRGHG